MERGQNRIRVHARNEVDPGQPHERRHAGQSRRAQHSRSHIPQDQAPAPPRLRPIHRRGATQCPRLSPANRSAAQENQRMILAPSPELANSEPSGTNAHPFTTSMWPSSKISSSPSTSQHLISLAHPDLADGLTQHSSLVHYGHCMLSSTTALCNDRSDSAVHPRARMRRCHAATNSRRPGRQPGCCYCRGRLGRATNVQAESPRWSCHFGTQYVPCASPGWFKSLLPGIKVSQLPSRERAVNRGGVNLCVVTAVRAGH
jgi:hypothetical protein